MVRAVIILGLLLSVNLDSTVAADPWVGQGVVIPGRSTSLRVQSPQIVKKVAKNVGDFVKKDEVLVQCDDEQARTNFNVASLSLKKAELEVKSSEAKEVAAKTNLEIRRKAGSSPLEIQLAEAEVAGASSHTEIAKVDVDLAKEVLNSAQKNLAELVLRAPFDAQVSGRYAEPGSLVAAGTTVIDLVAGPTIIDSAVPDRLVKEVAAKFPVEIGLLAEFGGQKFKGEIKQMSTIIDTTNRTFRIFVSLPDDAQKVLYLGMPVNLKIVPKEDEKAKPKE